MMHIDRFCNFVWIIIVIIIIVVIIVILPFSRVNSATTGQEQDGKDCPSVLTHPPPFPPGWGLAPREVEALISQDPEMGERLQVLAHLANFIADPTNRPLFRDLGLIANVDYGIETREFLATSNEAAIDGSGMFDEMLATFFTQDAPPSVLAGIEKARSRWTEMQDRMSAFLDLTGLSLDGDDMRTDQLSNLFISKDPEVHAALERLGPHLRQLGGYLGELRTSSRYVPVQFDKEYESLREKVKRFFKRSHEPIPSIRLLVEHFKLLHTMVANICASTLQLNEDAERDLQAIEYFRGSLLGEAKPIPQLYLRLVDAMKEFIDAKNFSMPTPQQAKKRAETVLAQYEINQAANMLVELASDKLSRLNFVQKYTFSATGLVSSPAVIQTLSRINPDEVFMDRGLNPVFEAMFTEVFLKKRVLSADEVQSRLRQNLRKEIRELRFARQYRTSVSPPLVKVQATPHVKTPPPPIVLTRAERMKRYAEAKQAESDQQNNPTPLNESSLDQTSLAILPVMTPQIEQDRMALLIDPSQSLEEARELLSTIVAPGEILAVTMRRTGFVYRVALSESVLDLFRYPQKDQPADFRDWLEAVSMGPARMYGERGFKKLPQARPYDWEIKILNSNFRLRGYRDGHGVWHFVRLVNEK